MPSDAFALPEWTQRCVEAWRATHGTSPGLRARMELALMLARNNVERRTGGPFGAAVFSLPLGELVAVGVNRVVENACSHAHAEMTAIAQAQREIGCHDLAQLISTLGAGEEEEGPMTGIELVSSAEPCAMCFGALAWSGITQLVCGARAEDTEAIGFDEGPKPPQWREALEARGIAVIVDICRNDARGIFARYAEMDGAIYNGRACAGT